MIGLISGDVIASPYVNNGRSDASDYFFPLFATSQKVSIRYGKRERDARAVSTFYEAKAGAMTDAAMAVAAWLRDPERTAKSLRESVAGVKRSPAMYLPLCALVGEGHRPTWGQDDSLDTDVSALYEVFGGSSNDRAAAVAVGLSLAQTVAGPGTDGKSNARAVFARNIASTTPVMLMESAEMFNAIAGGRKNVTEAGTLVDGTDEFNTKFFYDAAAYILSVSSSHEEAVRRATAMGGRYACELSALTGALGEWCWGVKDNIKTGVEDYLDADMRADISRFERYGMTQPSKDAGAERRADVEAMLGRMYDIVSYGKQVVYSVAPDDTDALAALVTLGKVTDKRVYAVSPDRFEILCKELAKPRDVSGKILDGLYIEGPKPEKGKVWLENGRFVTSTGRTFTKYEQEGFLNAGRKVPSPLRRQQVLSDWCGFVEYCRDVRFQLEENFFPGEGRDHGHVHFISAIYPDVPEDHIPRTIRLMRGDKCMAACGLDEDGLVAPMSSLVEMGDGSEYIQGAFEERNLFAGAYNLRDFKMKIDEYCLDGGMRVSSDEMREKDRGEEKELSPFEVPNYEKAWKDVSSNTLVEASTQSVEAVADRLGIDLMGFSAAQEKRASLGTALSKAYPGAVFTLGIGGMSQKSLERIVKTYGIDTVLDIRPVERTSFAKYGTEAYNAEASGKDRTPYGSFEEHTGASAEWFGDVLSCEPKNGATYESVRKDAGILANIQNIREAAREGARICIVSSEKSPQDSVRALVIGDELENPSDRRRKSVPVMHITGNGTAVSQGEVAESVLRSMHFGEEFDAKGAKKEDMTEAFSKKYAGVMEARKSRVEVWKTKKSEKVKKYSGRRSYKRSK